MAWPSANVSLANVDSASDRISSARADIEDAFTKLNEIIGEGPAIEAVAVSGQDTVVYSGGNGTLTLVAGTNVTLTTDNTAKSVTIAATGVGGSEVIDDTTPQLGGDLDTNDFRILNQPVNVADRHVINIGVLDGKTNQVNVDTGLLLMRGGAGSNQGYLSLSYPGGSGTIAAYNTFTSSSANVGIERLSLPNQLTGTPSNTTTPTGYILVNIGGVNRYIPYYT